MQSPSWIDYECQKELYDCPRPLAQQGRPEALFIDDVQTVTPIFSIRWTESLVVGLISSSHRRHF